MLKYWPNGQIKNKYTPCLQITQYMQTKKKYLKKKQVSNLSQCITNIIQD